MSNKTCYDCQSFTRAKDVPDRMGVTTEADVCFTFGHILSRPDQLISENERIKVSFASSCPEFDKPVPVTLTPRSLKAEVGIGDPAVMAGIGHDPNDKLFSCTGCSNFIPADVVRKELGWSLGMCAAKGRLLFPSKMITEASQCGVSVRGENRDSTNGVLLFNHYDKFGGTAPINLGGVGKAQTFDLNKPRVDPRDYVTDRPVTAEDAAQHIRAWRAVPDPEGFKPPVYAPIFNGTELCGFDPKDTYGNFRPDLYIDHQGFLYDMMVSLLCIDYTPLLIGPAGVGKSEMGCYVAYMMDLPWYNLPVEPGTEAWQFIGESKLEVDPASGMNVTVFRTGEAAVCWGVPCVWMVDEPNLNAEIFAAMRPWIGSSKMFKLNAAAGIQLKRDQFSFFLMSQNPHDPKYIGTQPMNAADISRVTPVFMDIPSEEIERGIIQIHCADNGYELPIKTLDWIMQVAEDIRGQITAGTLPIAWGVRDQVKVAVMTEFYSFGKAYRRAIVDALEAEQVDAVMGAVDSVMGRES